MQQNNGLDKNQLISFALFNKFLLRIFTPWQK